MLSLLALAGCGLSPVYGTGGNAQVLRNQIAFGVPDTVAGYRLQERLEETLGRASAPHWRLVTTLSQSLTSATIATDGATTRFNLVGAADWALIDSAGARMGSGTVDTFTSYSATGSTVATQAASADANARLSIALADLIVARLLLLSADLPQ